MVVFMEVEEYSKDCDHNDVQGKGFNPQAFVYRTYCTLHHKASILGLDRDCGALTKQVVMPYGEDAFHWGMGQMHASCVFRLPQNELSERGVHILSCMPLS